jgi:hypothetical protein
VEEQVSWWSGGQTCYQVPLSTIDKLVLGFYSDNQCKYCVNRRDTPYCTKQRTDPAWYSILVLYRYSRISTNVVFSTWDPPFSTASKAVPYPKKRYEDKNRGIVSTQEWKRE